MADFIEHIRKLRVLLQNLVTRVVIDRADGMTYQAIWGGGRVTSGLEHLETQGVHFRVPADAGGVVVAAGGQREAGVLLVSGGIVPQEEIGPGEGGLHYLGEWKLFLRSDGLLCLGEKLPTDWVALASKVDAELSKIKDDLSALKTAVGAGFTAVGVGASANGPAGKTAMDGALAGPPSWPSSADTVQSEKVRCA